MPKKRKTKAEKVASTYRLEQFKLKGTDIIEKKRERREFAYLSREYVVSDLKRSVLFSLLIILIEVVVARYWT